VVSTSVYATIDPEPSVIASTPQSTVCACHDRLIEQALADPNFTAVELTS
jgi:hypothetical protein